MAAALPVSNVPSNHPQHQPSDPSSTSAVQLLRQMARLSPHERLFMTAAQHREVQHRIHIGRLHSIQECKRLFLELQEEHAATQSAEAVNAMARRRVQTEQRHLQVSRQQHQPTQERIQEITTQQQAEKEVYQNRIRSVIQQQREEIEVLKNKVSTSHHQVVIHHRDELTLLENEIREICVVQLAERQRQHSQAMDALRAEHQQNLTRLHDELTERAESERHRLQRWFVEQKTRLLNDFAGEVGRAANTQSQLDRTLHRHETASQQELWRLATAHLQAQQHSLAARRADVATLRAHVEKQEGIVMEAEKNQLHVRAELRMMEERKQELLDVLEGRMVILRDAVPGGSEADKPPVVEEHKYSDETSSSVPSCPSNIDALLAPSKASSKTSTSSTTSTAVPSACMSLFTPGSKPISYARLRHELRLATARLLVLSQGIATLDWECSVLAKYARRCAHERDELRRGLADVLAHVRNRRLQTNRQLTAHARTLVQEIGASQAALASGSAADIDDHAVADGSFDSASPSAGFNASTSNGSDLQGNDEQVNHEGSLLSHSSQSEISSVPSSPASHSSVSSSSTSSGRSHQSGLLSHSSQRSSASNRYADADALPDSPPTVATPSSFNRLPSQSNQHQQISAPSSSPYSAMNAFGDLIRDALNESMARLLNADGDDNGDDDGHDHSEHKYADDEAFAFEKPVVLRLARPSPTAANMLMGHQIVDTSVLSSSSSSSSASSNFDESQSGTSFERERALQIQPAIKRPSPSMASNQSEFQTSCFPQQSHRSSSPSSPFLSASSSQTSFLSNHSMPVQIPVASSSSPSSSARIPPFSVDLNTSNRAKSKPSRREKNTAGQDVQYLLSSLQNASQDLDSIFAPTSPLELPRSPATPNGSLSLQNPSASFSPSSFSVSPSSASSTPSSVSISTSTSLSSTSTSSKSSSTQSSKSDHTSESAISSYSSKSNSSSHSSKFSKSSKSSTSSRSRSSSRGSHRSQSSSSSLSSSSREPSPAPMPALITGRSDDGYSARGDGDDQAVMMRRMPFITSARSASSSRSQSVSPAPLSSSKSSNASSFRTVSPSSTSSSARSTSIAVSSSSASGLSLDIESARGDGDLIPMQITTPMAMMHSSVDSNGGAFFGSSNNNQNKDLFSPASLLSDSFSSSSIFPLTNASSPVRVGPPVLNAVGAKLIAKLDASQSRINDSFSDSDHKNSLHQRKMRQSSDQNPLGDGSLDQSSFWRSSRDEGSSTESDDITLNDSRLQPALAESPRLPTPVTSSSSVFDSSSFGSSSSGVTAKPSSALKAKPTTSDGGEFRPQSHHHPPFQRQESAPLRLRGSAALPHSMLVGTSGGLARVSNQPPLFGSSSSSSNSNGDRVSTPLVSGSGWTVDSSSSSPEQSTIHHDGTEELNHSSDSDQYLMANQSFDFANRSLTRVKPPTFQPRSPIAPVDCLPSPDVSMIFSRPTTSDGLRQGSSHASSLSSSSSLTNHQPASTTAGRMMLGGGADQYRQDLMALMANMQLAQPFSPPDQDADGDVFDGGLFVDSRPSSAHGS